MKKQRSNTERAIQDLRALIISNELEAGSSHLEQELATRLGMSRTPVREACLVLEELGLVEVIPRRGIRILPVSPEDMIEIYEVLTELESLAAERVARQQLSTQELAGLALAIGQMEQALERGEIEAWAEADARFHDELLHLSGNRRLIRIVQAFNDQVRRARNLTLYLRPVPHKSNADHQELYEAIARGDAAAARDLHRAHRIYARELLTALLAKHGLTSV
ncbi:MAG: GntR family transcriptional regulator [Pseudomonadota bacterium]